MSYIGKVNYNNDAHLVASTLYGTCATDAADQVKVVTCTSFDKLMTGVTIHVKFTYANTNTSPQLNVNGTGAKNIYKFGTTAPGNTANTSWYAGSIVSFTYDGTYWIMNDHLDDTNTWIANNATTPGYVASPNSTSGLSWDTNTSGVPTWQNKYYFELSANDSLYTVINNMGWVNDVIV